MHYVLLPYMANQVRRLSGDENNPLISFSGNVSPQDSNKNFPDQRQKTRYGNPSYLLEEFDPYRARLAQIVHPVLRQLRALKWDPKEREQANRGLMEQMLYMAENQLEN